MTGVARELELYGYRALFDLYCFFYPSLYHQVLRACGVDEREREIE